jgi:uncharacterized protein YbjT (DUF2867 family)
MTTPLSTVTGAFGLSGRYIARKLLERGERVQTITGHPHRPDPFGGRVAAYPFNFDQPEALAETLKGTATLYNTYWVRFDRGDITFDRAVLDSLTLFEAAATAGVERVVHVSIANPEEGAEAGLPYYSGKARLEKALRESDLPHAILRPTVLFGGYDILLNNIAWLLRKFPVFAIPGDGKYRIQPIHVEDFAELAVAMGHASQNVVVDAAGPEIFTYKELVRLIADAIGRPARLMHLPPALVLAVTKVLNMMVHDVLRTREEIKGLMYGLLISGQPPLPQATTHLSGWVRANSRAFGTRYASEIQRHYR